MTTRSRQSVRLLLLSAMALALSVGATGLTRAQEATPAAGTVAEGLVLPPDAEVAGASLGEWAARWWQRMASFPMEVHPFLDEAGTRCGAAQSDPVFFLSGPPQLPAGTAITCVIPEDTPIFVPIISAECSTVEPPPFFGRDEAGLRACTTELIEQVTAVSVRINGQEVPDLLTYRTVSPLFTLTFAEENIFEVPPGIAQAVAAGYQLIIAGLPVGEHEIQVRAEVAGEVHTDNTYRVLVQEPMVVEPAASPEAGSPVASPAA